MIPIFYCGNDRIFEGVFLSAVSVARRTDTLDRALKRFHPESRAVRVDLTKEFVDAFVGGKNLKNSYTP